MTTQFTSVEEINRLNREIAHWKERYLKLAEVIKENAECDCSLDDYEIELHGNDGCGICTGCILKRTLGETK